MLKIWETDRAKRVVYSTMVLIVADFFWLSLVVGRQFVWPRKGHGPLAVTFGYVKSCTLHARPAGFTDRPEIGHRLRPYIASSEVCACAASESRLTFFSVELGNSGIRNRVPDDLGQQLPHRHLWRVHRYQMIFGVTIQIGIYGGSIQAKLILHWLALDAPSDTNLGPHKQAPALS
jgi:hypothetical protein